MRYYCENKENVLKDLQTSEQGLSSLESNKRLEKNGKNQLKVIPPQSFIRKFFQQLTAPMTIILLVAATVSGVLSAAEDESFADVIIILTVVIVNAILGVYQERKAEKAIECLQEMSAATSKVIRDGIVQIVNSSDLVVGDIILLESGDIVTADARILESAGLKIEEAALTGESVPVTKCIDMIHLRDGVKDVPLGDRKNMMYMGSTIVYGRGKAVITATGMDTEMGKIAEAISKAEEPPTPLQQKLDQLSKILTKLVISICLVVFIVQLLRAANLNCEFIMDSFMIAVSLAVAAIPEGLTTVVTIVLSIGVTNMSRQNAIIRKLTAVETLGCAQIICSDKTGTLTQNKMTVVDFFGENQEAIASAMALCSDAEIDDEKNITGEPTEAALVAWANKLSFDKNVLKETFPRCQEAPFDSVRKMMSTVHKYADSHVQYTKGAPEIIINRCTSYLKEGKMLPMTPDYKNQILSANKSMANRALRVLACAERILEKEPECCTPEYLEKDLCFIGLCGMIDPVRPEAKKAIAKCKEAGIRPILITGDHVDTAIAIAKELGIITDSTAAITGSLLDEMNDDIFKKEYQKISVYARVQPEHKTRIVNTWKQAGFVTAMTGDGINDAPSIKSADIGVGMGITGTAVTKDVADMVLADDNFATIVGAVEEGRKIYDNIRKAIQFLLGSNISEVFCIFLATLMGFSILKPVHLLWINLVTDGFPALALGMEHAENNIMKRSPRDAKSGVFAGGMGFDIIYQGIVVTVLVLISYFTGHFIETGAWTLTDSAEGTTMAFLTMSMAEIFHSINMRSQHESIFKLKTNNLFLYGAVLSSFTATTIVCEVPFIANAFGLTSVEPLEYIIAMLFGVCVIPIVELVKAIQRKKQVNPLIDVI